MSGLKHTKILISSVDTRGLQVGCPVVDPGFTKGGGIIMDACCLYDHTFVYLPKLHDGRWSKIVLLQKDLFFLDFMSFFPIFKAFPVQILGKHTFHTFFLPQISLFHFFSLRPHPPLIQNGGGGGTLYMHVHFPIGTRPHLAQKGGACA